MDEAVYKTNLPNLTPYRGKIRDVYNFGEEVMLIVSTDRVSAFDVVMPNALPGKGIILNSMSAFWFRTLREIVPNHMISLASDKDTLTSGILPDLIKLPTEIEKRGMFVRRAKRINIECIVRAYLVGSAWTEYSKSGTVNSEPIREMMLEAERFPDLRFTPSSKSSEGHDIPLSRKETENIIGTELYRTLEDVSLRIFSHAEKHIRKKGMILADTKFEFGFVNDELTLIDELLTPDSSRFWYEATWEPGNQPPPLDKQFLRNWLLTQDWDKTYPAPQIPSEIINKTLARYKEVYERITKNPTDVL